MTNEEIRNYLKVEIPRLERELQQLHNYYKYTDDKIMQRITSKKRFNLAVYKTALHALNNPPVNPNFLATRWPW
jgi:hypothetical protein